MKSRDPEIRDNNGIIFFPVKDQGKIRAIRAAKEIKFGVESGR